MTVHIKNKWRSFLLSEYHVQRYDNKHIHVVSFKEACTITRKYYRLHNNEPPDRIYAEILTYTVPAREGRSDKRNMKPKSAVWFVYRVA